MAEYGHEVSWGDPASVGRFLRAVKVAQEEKCREAETDAQRIFEVAFLDAIAERRSRQG